MCRMLVLRYGCGVSTVGFLMRFSYLPQMVSCKYLDCCRNRILQCYVIPILTYGSECWTISPNMERKLEATEMWFHRRMLHISWKDHVTNDEVLRRGRTERKLMNRIRAGQMSFLVHIMRKHGLENIVVTGKIEGERSRGRPRLNFMKSLSQLLKISEVEIIERTRNREEWKTMTANVRIGYGT